MGLITVYWCQSCTPLLELCVPKKLVRDCSSACTSVCVWFSHQKAKDQWVVDIHSVFLPKLKCPKGTRCCWLVQLDVRGTGNTCPYVSLSLTNSYFKAFHPSLYPTPTTFLSSCFCISRLSLFSCASPSNSFPHRFLLSESLVNIFVYT